jgi:hypothetical protein
MTSTRNKNTQGDYNVKKQESVMIRDYLLYNDEPYKILFENRE